MLLSRSPGPGRGKTSQDPLSGFWSFLVETFNDYSATMGDPGASEEIGNPYGGMPRCGEIVQD